MANNKSIFILKTVNKTTLLTAFKKIKKKKSSGSDGLTQEQLAFGMEELADPLQKFFNESILSGNFPAQWKTAIVTPVPKKGDKSQYENYRPVSCLPAAAKLLESLICNQVSKYQVVCMVSSIVLLLKS